MPGIWGFVVLELDPPSAFLLELDTPLFFLLELEFFLLELELTVVVSLLFSEEDSAETFLEELEVAFFLLEELAFFSDFLEEELFSLEELEILASSSLTGVSSSKADSSRSCIPLCSSSPTVTTSESVVQLQNEVTSVNTPNTQTFLMGFLMNGSPFVPT
jgi:hypothetical protein